MNLQCMAAPDLCLQISWCWQACCWLLTISLKWKWRSQVRPKYWGAYSGLGSYCETDHFLLPEGGSASILAGALLMWVIQWFVLLLLGGGSGVYLPKQAAIKPSWDPQLPCIIFKLYVLSLVFRHVFFLAGLPAAPLVFSPLRYIKPGQSNN